MLASRLVRMISIDVIVAVQVESGRAENWIDCGGERVTYEVRRIVAGELARHCRSSSARLEPEEVLLVVPLLVEFVRPDDENQVQ